MKTARTIEGAALALALVGTTLGPSRAHAGDDGAIVVVIEDPSERVDVHALREGISADLGVPLATDVASAPETLVRVRVVPDGSVEVEVETGGATRRRVVAIPEDRSEATRIIVLLSANLARDESAELLAGMISPAPRTQVTDDRAGALATPVLTDSAALASQEEGERYARGLRRPSRTPAERNFRVAFTFRSGAYDRGGTAADPFLLFGAELAFDVGSMLALGLADIGFSTSSAVDAMGNTFFAVGVSGTPYVELHAFVDRRIELYGRLGTALQGRSQTLLDEGHFQLAAYVGGGARFYVGGNAFFLGIEIAMHIVATDAYLLESSLVQGTTVGSGALSVGWTF